MKISGKSSPYLSIGEAAQLVAGTITGDHAYYIQGMTAIGSAKEFELAVVFNDQDVKTLLKSDAECVLTNKEYAVFIPSYCSVIIVEDVAKAADILAAAFTKMNS